MINQLVQAAIDHHSDPRYLREVITQIVKKTEPTYKHVTSYDTSGKATAAQSSRTHPTPVTPLTEKQLRELHHIEEFGLFCSYEEFEEVARAIEQLQKVKP